MREREEREKDAYETLLSQLEFVLPENLPKLDDADVLRKSLDQGLAILTSSVLAKLEKSFDDRYLFGYYSSNLYFGDSVIVTSVESGKLREREVGRFIPRRRIGLRELKNAGRQGKVLVIKRENGYDALQGTGKTIKPVRVAVVEDKIFKDFLREVRK